MLLYQQGIYGEANQRKINRLDPTFWAKALTVRLHALWPVRQHQHDIFRRVPYILCFFYGLNHRSCEAHLLKNKCNQISKFST